MVKKITKYAKFVVCCALILSLVAPSYAALSASDGSAFVTKAEFDSALADFNARLTTFEAGINSKIDSQVTSYLDRNGIWNGKNWEVTPSGVNYWSTSNSTSVGSTRYGSNGSGKGLLFCCNQAYTNPASNGASSQSYQRRGIAWVASDCPKSGLCVVDFNIGAFSQGNYTEYTDSHTKLKAINAQKSTYTYSQWQSLWMGNPGSSANFISSTYDMGAAAFGSIEFFISKVPFKWYTDMSLATDPVHSCYGGADAGGATITLGYSSSYNTKFLNDCDCVSTISWGSWASFYGRNKWTMMYCGYTGFRGVATFFVSKHDNLGYWSGATIGVYSATPDNSAQGWYDGSHADRSFLLTVY